MEDTSQEQIFSEIAELIKALGNGHRLMLLEHIAQGERSVDRLAELSGMPIANTSQHLQTLRRAGFVTTRRDGKRVLYRLSDGPVIPLLAAIRGYAEHNRAEVRELISGAYTRNGTVEEITSKELLERLREGAVTLLDVRAEDEFALGHLPGAFNIPSEELEKRFKELPKDREIVAYCRGPYCVMSVEATVSLAQKGYKVSRLSNGFPDWFEAGFPIETEAVSGQG